MLQMDQVLCLMSGMRSSSAGFCHGRDLAGPGGSVLHVIPVGTSEGGVGQETLWEPIQSVDSANSVEIRMGPRVERTDEGLRIIQRYLHREGVSLVVTDPPVHRGVTPPMADPFLQRLIVALDESIFVVGEKTRPPSIRDILVPTDLSGHSFRALVHASALADQYEASIHLLHVVEKSPYVALTSSDQLSLSESTLADHRAHRRLRKFVGQGREVDASIESHLAFGNPENEIAHFVQTHDVDLMVLSSHGTTTELQTPLGHVADRVGRRIPVPVFLVRAFGPSLVGRTRSE